MFEDIIKRYNRIYKIEETIKNSEFSFDNFNNNYTLNINKENLLVNK